MIQNNIIAFRERLYNLWHLFWRENQLVRTAPKKSAKRRAPDLENQESGYGPRYSTTPRIQFALNWSKLDPGSSSNVGP